MAELASIAPRFVAMAHRIVWCTVGTVDAHGSPRTRVMHPIWEWDGTDLTGWIITTPGSPKGRDLDRRPELSLTYWAPNQDTCTADCATEWDDTPELRQAGWDRFAHGPEPVGYDPSVVARWSSPDADAFGVLRLRPSRLRVLDGERLADGPSAVQIWKR